MQYSLRKKVAASDFSEVVEETKEALKEQGFGILTVVDVQATLSQKLGVEYGQYIILGACNPPLAYQALQAEKEIGLFLPCNIIVYEENSEFFVSTILPTAAMNMLDNPALQKVAREVENKLRMVLDHIE
ncbi:MAG: ABC transporter ATP-binding protein [Candidatus Moranbacteria bacterium RIFCSPHIGHO2_01_FULL_55_24]|nr:MAG: ABC transporter ATP-binding protein [Candidatus Moranbacteria bacterium RIFCSPHIGHO2_01_FULL_55_24]